MLLFVLIGAIVLLVINVTAQLNLFYSDLPRYQTRIRELLSKVMEFINTLRERMGNILPEDQRAVREVKISESPFATTRAFFAQIGDLIEFLLYAATVPFLTLFMLKDREKFARVIEGMLARHPRYGRGHVTREISRAMTAYALGLSFVMLIMAAATTIALMLLQLNYYYILGSDRGPRHPAPLRGHHLLDGAGRRRGLLPVRRPARRWSSWSSTPCCSSWRATS